MLNSLTTQRPSIKPLNLSSPPSRALKNYAKASLATESAVNDTVTLSEAAKDQPATTSGLRKAGTFVALGLSLLGVAGGVTGCASSTAMAQTTQPATQTTQESATDKVDLRKDTEQAPETYKQGVQRRTKMLTDMFKGDNAEEVAENIGTGGRKIGEEVVKDVKAEGQRITKKFKGKNAEEIAETVGKDLGEKGKKIGDEAVKVSKEVSKVAKGFWRGLTGKGKKAN